ncbi:MAG TPA: hypothetical protein VGP12_10385 [Nitrosospira sp.]|nr:hypothetical protein [Nitrosospira sp.]
MGDESKLDPEMFDSLSGVEYSMHIVKQYKIVSRESHKDNSVTMRRPYLSAALRKSFSPSSPFP